MKRVFLFFAAALIIVSCDNLKKKNKTKEDDTELTDKDKKKDKTDEDETKPDKNKLDDEDYASKKKKTDDEENDHSTNSDGWSSTEQKTFMNTCVEGAKESMSRSSAEDYCDCMLKKLQDIYPSAKDADDMTKEKMTQLARKCLNL